MQKHWPLFLVAAGLFLLAGGFVYAVIFAGIPYQDPTPEMYERFRFHDRVSKIFCLFGFGTMLAGGLSGWGRKFFAKRK